jgi:hypothetical protein
VGFLQRMRASCSGRITGKPEVISRPWINTDERASIAGSSAGPGFWIRSPCRHTGIYLTSMSALAISHHSKIGLSS